MSKLKKDDVDALIIATTQKANRIKHIDNLLDQMPLGKAKKTYTKEMLEMIEDYNTQVNILDIIVNDYIKQVKEDSGEYPLLYYRLARELKKV